MKCHYVRATDFPRKEYIQSSVGKFPAPIKGRTSVPTTVSCFQGKLQHLGLRQGVTKVDGEINLSCGISGFNFRLHGSSGKVRVGTVGFEEKLRKLCEDGDVDAALNVLLSMEHKVRVPSVTMYKSLLKACTKRKALAQAKRLHAHLTTRGLELLGLLGEDVVNTLIKCGELEDALRLFERLPCRTSFSWTAVISAHTAERNYKEALRLYYCMREEGLKLNKYTFVSLLRACGSLCELDVGKEIHDEVLRYRCESDLIVGTCLVDMYAKCGSISDAQNVFDRLTHIDVVTWNVMIAAYSLQGQTEKTLQLYGEMLQAGVSPNNRTFVAVLQLFGMLAKEQEADTGQVTTKLRCLEKAKVIHSEAWSRGYSSDVFICNALISLCGNCGSLVDVQSLFSSLSQADVVSWTSVIAAFALQEHAWEAFQHYGQMLEEGVSPNDCTFVSMLQACQVLAEREERRFVECLWMAISSLGIVKAIHAEAWKRGYYSHVFVGSTLISLYGKCGSTGDAQTVFDAMTQRTVVSWNAFMMSHVQQGQGREVLDIYERMLEEGPSPDDGTFVAVLQACGMLAEEEVTSGRSSSIPESSLQMVKVIHTNVWKRGYGTSTLLGNTLTCTYVRCGSVEDAHIAFHGLFKRDVASWTILLSAYLQQRQVDKAIMLYNDMQGEGVSPDDKTYVALVQACSMVAEEEDCTFIEHGQPVKLRSLQMGRTVHADVWRGKFVSDCFVGSTLITFYGRCATLKDACVVFDGLCHQDVASWNAMLTACVQLGEAETGLHLYGQMVTEGVITPDDCTFVSVLQACAVLADKEDGVVVVDVGAVKAACLEKGKAIHAEIVLKGYVVDGFVGNTLVNVYGKCWSFEDAQTTFHDEIRHRDVVSWNAMLAAYAQLGQGDKVLQLYRQMQQEEEDVTANDITLLCMLQACKSTGSLNICTEIKKSLVASAGDDGIVNHLVASTLIHAYGQCGSMMEAESMFHALLQPDVVSWTALIAGYARQGNYSASMELYKRMQVAGVQPDGVTFLCLISVCTHAGLVGKGVEYFESMSRDHGLTPQLEHYVGMVDLLGRAGCFTRVTDLLSAMPVQPSVSLWLCLLGACQKHGLIGLGRHAYECALRLEPKNAAAYVLMANIYAQAGLQECADEVNELRQAAGAWKKPGQSWIVYGEEVHTFVAEDSHHLQQVGLYHCLEIISWELMERQLNGMTPL